MRIRVKEVIITNRLGRIASTVNTMTSLIGPDQSLPVAFWGAAALSIALSTSGILGIADVAAAWRRGFLSKGSRKPACKDDGGYQYYKMCFNHEWNLFHQ